MFVHGTFISMLILISSVIMLGLAIKICNTLCKWMNISNILYFFMINYVVYAFIGSVIFNVWFTPACKGYLVYERPDILIYVWLITSSGLFAIPCFTAMFYRVFGFNSHKENSILKNKSEDFKNFYLSKKLYTLCWLLYLLCLGVLLLYLKKIGGASIAHIAAPAAEKALLRSDSTNNFSGKLWRYTLFYKDIPIFLMIYVMFYKKKTLFFVVFIHNCFVAVMNFEKGPLMNLIIILVIVYAMKHKKLPMKFLLAIFVIMLSLILAMYKLFMGSKNLGMAMLGMVQRLFTGQIVPFTWYFKYVEKNGFLYGTSFPNPGGILPFEWVRLTVEVMNLYHLEAGRPTDLVGSMPSVFMAEWYANFGIIGIIVSFMIFALIIAFLDAFFVRKICKKPSVIIICLYIYLVYYFHQYSGGGFSGIITDMGILVPIFLTIVFEIINNTNLHYIFSVNYLSTCVNTHNAKQKQSTPQVPS